MNTTTPQTAAGTPTGLRGRPCSVAAGLGIVGERWSLLIVRELLFGVHRFDGIAANTGAPRDRLTARLQHLESAGIIERRRYHERPPRFEYHLTQAGRELGTVLDALRSWGDRWAVDQPPAQVLHKCGHELRTTRACAHCGEPLRETDLSVHSRVPGWDLHGRTD